MVGWEWNGWVEVEGGSGVGVVWLSIHVEYSAIETMTELFRPTTQSNILGLNYLGSHRWINQLLPKPDDNNFT